MAMSAGTSPPASCCPAHACISAVKWCSLDMDDTSSESSTARQPRHPERGREQQAAKRPQTDIQSTGRRVMPKLTQRTGTAATPRSTSLLDLPCDVMQRILLLVAEAASGGPAILSSVSCTCKALKDVLDMVRPFYTLAQQMCIAVHKWHC